MIELPTENGRVYCELITIQDAPFIFFSTLKDVQKAITQIYPVRYYSIESAFNEFLTYKKNYNEIR
jgi:hypothetical protein